MKIEAFGVEQWMNEWETKCAYNVAETCVSPLRLKNFLNWRESVSKDDR